MKKNSYKLDNIHSHALLYFTDESKERTEKVLHMYQLGSKPDISFTRGMFIRGVE